MCCLQGSAAALACDINAMPAARLLLLKQLLQMCHALGQAIAWLSLREADRVQRAQTSAKLWQALVVPLALHSSVSARWHQGHAERLAVFGSAQCCCARLSRLALCCSSPVLCAGPGQTARPCACRWSCHGTGCGAGHSLPAEGPSQAGSKAASGGLMHGSSCAVASVSAGSPALAVSTFASRWLGLQSSSAVRAGVYVVPKMW